MAINDQVDFLRLFLSLIERGTFNRNLSSDGAPIYHAGADLKKTTRQIVLRTPKGCLNKPTLIHWAQDSIAPPLKNLKYIYVYISIERLG